MSEAKSCPKCASDLPANAPEGICPTCLLQAGLPGDSAAGAASELEPTLAASSGFVPPKPEELGKQFPQLEILELLGKGGMGAVYKARQPELDRLVAVKILPPELGANPDFSHRFTREARALAKLSHQNIVSVFEFGQIDGQYYFVMEFVDGANLRHLMETGDIEPSEALAIVPQICEALQFAHHEGVVHRDIKPENILIDKQGRVKIADFGLVKLLNKTTEDAKLTGTTQAMGTLHYMAPEQMRGAANVDNRADIYSLGVVFYEMLTGELPIGRFAPPSTKIPVDDRLDEVVLRALANAPEQRYQQVSEVKTDIDSITANPSVGTSKVQPPQASDEITPSRFSRRAILGAVWAAFFFVAIPPASMLVTARSAPERGLFSEGSPLWFLAVYLLLALLPFGATAPFGTTILGVISVSNIRHSKGRLVGLPLALADALLFPLLLINVLIIATCVYLPVPVATPFAFVVGLLLCAMADVPIIRLAWRQTKDDRNGGTSDVKPKQSLPSNSAIE